MISMVLLGWLVAPWACSLDSHFCNACYSCLKVLVISAGSTSYVGFFHEIQHIFIS